MNAKLKARLERINRARISDLDALLIHYHHAEYTLVMKEQLRDAPPLANCWFLCPKCERPISPNYELARLLHEATARPNGVIGNLSNIA